MNTTEQNEKEHEIEQILSDPIIKKFMDTHHGAAKRVKHAAEFLINKSDAVEALKKLFTALSEKEIYVFFSYKKKDECAAKEIVEVLRKSSADKLKITYQAEFTEDCVGKRWRSKIRDEIHHANWFILLFPDPSDDWDWCLFETGLFESKLTSADRLICLHHPDTKIPNPIEGYHAVPATVPEVAKFLRSVLIKENPIYGLKAINKNLSEEEVEDYAKKIVNAIRPPKLCLIHKIFEPLVVLKFKDLSSIQNIVDLDTGTLEYANQEALSLFDFDQKPSTLGDLRSSLNEKHKTNADDQWREELFKVIRKIADGRKFSPIQGIFRAKDDRHYRPVMHSVDRMGSLDGIIVSFHITFSEEISVVDISSIPKDLSTLATYLRFAFRFRWEVLEKFSNGPLTVEDVERLHNTMERIRIDAKSRNVEGVDSILPLFTAEQAKRIEQMYSDWYQVSNPERKGELDNAIKKKETEIIPDILSRFIPASQEFLEISANCFSELVSKNSKRDR